MESSIIDKIKDWIVILIPFLLICSGIYHLTYWNTFNLNGLEIISIENFIKTIIKPFIKNSYILSYFLIGILIYALPNLKIKKEPIIENEHSEDSTDEINSLEDVQNSLSEIRTKLDILKVEHSKSLRRAKVTLILLLIFWVSLLLFALLSKDWQTLPYYFAISVGNLFLLLNKNENKYTYILPFTIALIITSSFTSAKIESSNLKNNKSFKYITKRESGKISVYKCLGETDEHIIVSDLENSKIIYFLKSEDGLIFRFYNP